MKIVELPTDGLLTANPRTVYITLECGITAAEGLDTGTTHL